MALNKTQQKIKATIPVEFAIPDKYVLVERKEWQSLQHLAESERVYWSLSDVAKILNTRVTNVRSEILANPRYHDDLVKLEHEGVIRPRPTKNSPWKFVAIKFRPWLEEHANEFNF